MCWLLLEAVERSAAPGGPPPVLIVVTDTIDNANAIWRRIGGRFDPYDGASPGIIPLLSNVHDGRPRKVYASILGYDRPIETTLLVNQTYRKGKRVSSAFTVESHNPYRITAPGAVAAGSANLEGVSAGGHAADVLARLAAMLERNGLRDMDDRRTEITGVTEWPDAQRRVLTPVGWSEGSRCGIAMLEPGVTADYATVKSAVTEAMRSPEDIRSVVIAAFGFGAGVRQATAERGSIAVRLVQTNQDLQLEHIEPDRAMRAFVEIGNPMWP